MSAGGKGGFMKLEQANERVFGPVLIIPLMMIPWLSQYPRAAWSWKQRPAITLTGIVSDSLCGTDHGINTAADAECTRACVELGAQYALVVGKNVYVLQGHQADLERFAGNEVRLKGRVISRDTIIVDQVARWYSEAEVGMK